MQTPITKIQVQPVRDLGYAATSQAVVVLQRKVNELIDVVNALQKNQTKG